MEFIVHESVTQSYGIQAATPEDAIKKREKGEGIAMPNRTVNRSVVARPQPPMQAPQSQGASTPALDKFQLRQPGQKPKGRKKAKRA